MGVKFLGGMHMSNNHETESDEVKYVPKLRFEEFKDSEWILNPLGKLAYYENGKAHENDIVDNGKFIVANSKFISSESEIKKFTNEPLCIAKRNDILMVLSDVPNGKAIAKCFLVKKNDLYTVNQRICKLTSKNIVSEFLFYTLNRNSYLLKFDDGIKQTNLRKEDVLSCPIAFPKVEKEQQKIASCLSSLDELIQNESSKLEAYKQHKSGLLQQLFPRDGGSLPSLRFDEFSENWRKQKIGDFIEDFLDKSTSHDEYEVFTSSKSGLMKQTEYYENSRLSTRDNSGFNVIPPNYITYRSRSDNRKFYFNENKLGVTGLVSTYYPVFKIVNGFNHFFIELFSRYQDEIGKYSIGTSQTVLSIKELKRISLPVPKTLEEQQKIAFCLSSLDSLMAHQTDYIEQLKQYKNGLMQQLFPVLEDVSA